MGLDWSVTHAPDRSQLHSVVIPGLEEVDSVGGDEVDEAMFLCEAPRPGTRSEEPERLRLSNTLEGIPHDRLDEIENAER